MNAICGSNNFRRHVGGILYLFLEFDIIIYKKMLVSVDKSYDIQEIQRTYIRIRLV